MKNNNYRMAWKRALKRENIKIFQTFCNRVTYDVKQIIIFCFSMDF